VASGYCPAHQAAARESRPSACRRGYGRRWQRYRLSFLACNPVCALCRLAAAEHVDHIRPVTGASDPGFFSASNHQGLCRSCHSAKTAAEDRGFGNRRR